VLDKVVVAGVKNRYSVAVHCYIILVVCFLRVTVAEKSPACSAIDIISRAPFFVNDFASLF